MTGHKKIPRVTVLVPTYNRANFLAECLDSLFSQTLLPEQVIVVNDGSTDGTAKILEGYRGKIDIFQVNRQGKSVSINRGLSEVRGDYVWIFDDDDVALPDALERLVKPLEKDGALGFSYCRYYYTATQPDSHKIGRIISAEKKPDLKKRGFLIPLLEANVLGGAALFARTACYQTVGHFDPKLVRSQDYEMAIRIARRFQGESVEGGPTFHYRQHGGARGDERDRFLSGLRLDKWREYDQMIFRALYRELSLEDYLPPGTSLEGHERQARLQRMVIMAGKLLNEEVLKDAALLGASGAHPFSGREKELLRSLVSPPYYEAGSLLEVPSFFRDFMSAVSASGQGERIRAELYRGLVQAFMRSPGRRRWGVVLRVGRLLGSPSSTWYSKEL